MVSDSSHLLLIMLYFKELLYLLLLKNRLSTTMRLDQTMKKIALIMDSWKRYFIYAWPAGILQRIHETQEEVNLYIFNSAGNWSSDEDYNLGEYNIYRLPDLKEFDGIILDLTNVSLPAIAEEITVRAKNAGVPVISIGNDIPDFYHVGIDNYSSMKEMISHLHQCHGCQKFWFIMASPDNYENQQRTAALRDYMEEKGILYSEDDFYFESYDYSCGIHGFHKMRETHCGLPDAVMCANDNIAVGVCEAAASFGLQVPEDFCVTGFDNFDKASRYTPHLSTISYVREEVGYCCADVFLRLWKGETVPRVNYAASECIYWQSCGCSSKESPDNPQYLKNTVLYELETDVFNSHVLALSRELMQCHTIEDMMYCIPKSIPSMRCDAMYLVLDDSMDFYREQTKTDYFLPQIPEKENFNVEGYPKTMRIKFAYENGRKTDCENLLLHDIFPQFTSKISGTDFLFLPLHFGCLTVGYFVIQNAVYLMEKQYLFQVMNAVNTALENLHKNEKLEYMNQALSRMYNMDAMTGIYNRRGYRQFFKRFIENAHQSGKQVLVLFLDLDNLKTINDSLGHEYGDLAIIAIGNSIRKYCTKQGLAARTGGDEFVLLQYLEALDQPDRLKENINAELQRQSDALHFPGDLSVSIGASISDPASSRTLDDYVREADEAMYREKMPKKNL